MRAGARYHQTRVDKGVGLNFLVGELVKREIAVRERQCIVPEPGYESQSHKERIRTGSRPVT